LRHLILLMLLLCTAAPAGAASRVIVGTSLGGGLRASSHDVRTISPQLALPALEFGLFTHEPTSVELSIPVLRMIASAALLERMWIGFDAYPLFREHLVGNVWAVAGPGIGWMASAGRGNGTFGLRGCGRIGMEFRNASDGFALALLLQPDVLVEFGDIGVAVSGGAVATVRVAWLRPRR
jgi:hypothetical protein